LGQKRGQTRSSPPDWPTRRMWAPSRASGRSPKGSRDQTVADQFYRATAPQLHGCRPPRFPGSRSFDRDDVPTPVATQPCPFLPYPSAVLALGQVLDRPTSGLPDWPPRRMWAPSRAPKDRHQRAAGAARWPTRFPGPRAAFSQGVGQPFNMATVPTGGRDVSMGLPRQRQGPGGGLPFWSRPAKSQARGPAPSLGKRFSAGKMCPTCSRRWLVAPPSPTRRPFSPWARNEAKPRSGNVSLPGLATTSSVNTQSRHRLQRPGGCRPAFPGPRPPFSKRWASRLPPVPISGQSDAPTVPTLATRPARSSRLSP
jgi:hypothetical protein